MAERHLARFRADPWRVRVTVRRFDDERHGVYWRASIGNKETGLFVSAPGKTAIRAVVAAFRLAEERDMPSLDRHMGWTYDHPQGELAPSTRVTRVAMPSPGTPGKDGNG